MMSVGVQTRALAFELGLVILAMASVEARAVDLVRFHQQPSFYGHTQGHHRMISMASLFMMLE